MTTILAVAAVPERIRTPYCMSHKCKKRPSRVIAAIAAASVLTACVGRHSGPSPAEIAKPLQRWLKEKPRTVLISSRIQPVKARFKFQETGEHTQSYGVARGAGAGAAQGLGEGLKGCVSPGGAIACPIILPLFLLIGLGLGAGAGAMSGRRSWEYERDLDTADFKGATDAIAEALKEINVTRSMARRTAEITSKETSHKVSLTNDPPSNPWGYPKSPSEAKVALSFEKLQLIAKGEDSRELKLQVVISSETTAPIDGFYCIFRSRRYSFESRPAKIDKWAADNAKLFKQEVANAVSFLATQVVVHLFKKLEQKASTCDVYNSPAILDLQANWKHEIRLKLVPGKSTRKEVLALLGHDGMKLQDTGMGSQIRYLFHEKSIIPGSKGELEWRFLSIVFDKNDLVKYVWTYLDADTAIHRISKVQVGKTTRQEALRILGEPPSMLNPESDRRIRYEKSPPGAWVLEVLFDRRGVVRYIYQRKGRSIDFVSVCDAARHGSQAAQEELGDHFYFGSSKEKDTMPKAYKWYLVLKQNGGRDFSHLISPENHSTNEINEARRLAVSWPKGPCP